MSQRTATVVEDDCALHTHAQRGTLWPRPGRAAPPVVLVVACVAGLTAATVLPLGRLGLGVPITGLVLAGLGVLLARRLRAHGDLRVRDPAPSAFVTPGDGRPEIDPSPASPASPAPASPEPAAEPVRPGEQSKAPPATAWTAAWTAISLGLLALTTVRAAEWLGVLCLLGAAVAGSLAVAGGRSTRGLLLGAVAVPVLALGALPWAGRGALALHRRDGASPVRVGAATLVALALLAVFTPLLAGADAAFGRLVGDLIPTPSNHTAARAVLFTLFALAALGAGYLLHAPARPDPARSRAGRLRRVEWALPVGLLAALFGVFVGVSLAALFGGGDHVLRTTGLTYAEYARSGFWQLLLVSLLTLPVIMVAGRNAATATAADRAWLRGLLGALAVLTLVIVASALSRMWAYQQAYGFTVLRVLVSVVEVSIGMVYLMLLVAGRRLRAPWLPRAVLGTGLAALLALGTADADRFIAERNIDRFERTGVLDVDHLRGLSADAVPALERLPEPLRACALARIVREVGQPDDWRAWNAARADARARTAGLAVPPADCAAR